MTVDVNITNAKLFWRRELVDGGLSIDKGRIIAVGKEPNLYDSDVTINAKGMLCLPGLVDIHVHLRDLELSYKEDFVSGTSAAAAGGFTTVVDMPNTRPTTDRLSLLEEKIRIASSKILVNVGFNLVPSSVDQMDEAKDRAMGFKFNLVTQWSDLVMNEETISSVVHLSASLGKTAIFHAEDGEIVKKLEERLKSEKGIGSYYKAHPPEAEERSVKKILNCAAGSRSRIHFCHISTLGSLAAIKEAKLAGARVSCEVTPHHALLDEETVAGIGGVAIMDPPLRDRAVSQALFNALEAGGIDLIASDHAPHSLQEKKDSIWWKIPPGIPGLETTLPLFLTQVKQGRISLARVMEALSAKPLEVFGLKRKGIEVGAEGDLVLVDFEREAEINSSAFLSKAKYSPFDGVKVTGWPQKTFVKGQLVYDEGMIVSAPGSGRVLLPRGSGASSDTSHA